MPSDVNLPFCFFLLLGGPRRIKFCRVGSLTGCVCRTPNEKVLCCSYFEWFPPLNGFGMDTATVLSRASECCTKKGKWVGESGPSVVTRVLTNRLTLKRFFKSTSHLFFLQNREMLCLSKLCLQYPRTTAIGCNFPFQGIDFHSHVFLNKQKKI